MGRGTGVSVFLARVAGPDDAGVFASVTGGLAWGAILPYCGGGTGVSVLVRLTCGREEGVSPVSSSSLFRFGFEREPLLPLSSLGVSDGLAEPWLPRLKKSFAVAAIFLTDASASSAACLASASLLDFFASLSFIPRLFEGSVSGFTAPVGIFEASSSADLGARARTPYPPPQLFAWPA